MPKAFFASGFLFHPESQQILLHQSNSLWSLFGEINEKEEDALLTFQRIIHKALKIKLAKKCIYPVYNYFHKTHHKMHYVYYAQVEKMKNYTSQNETLSWFTFKQTLKLPFTEETKQDIVVAQRVIEADERVALHTQYFRPVAS